eukprot:UN06662
MHKQILVTIAPAALVALQGCSSTEEPKPEPVPDTTVVEPLEDIVKDITEPIESAVRNEVSKVKSVLTKSVQEALETDEETKQTIEESKNTIVDRLSSQVKETIVDVKDAEDVKGKLDTVYDHVVKFAQDPKVLTAAGTMLFSTVAYKFRHLFMKTDAPKPVPVDPKTAPPPPKKSIVQRFMGN